MPLYDYRCTVCGHEVEVMHAIDGSGPAACDVCGGAMRKALSPPAIHFKGSGWAKKDARTGGAGKAGSSKAAEGSSKAADGDKAASAPTKDAGGEKASSAATATPKGSQASGSGAD